MDSRILRSTTILGQKARLLFFVIGLLGVVAVANAEVLLAGEAAPVISPKEHRAAVAFFRQHSASREIKLFERYPPERKAFYLGNMYWAVATKDRDWMRSDDEGKKSHDLAKRFLLSAALRPGDLNPVELGMLYHNLAQIEHVRGNFAHAEKRYRKSIDFENEDACVNLGVMWERQARYDKALSAYHGCLPKLKSSILLLNLGSIYYNGLGRPRDHVKGAMYWKQSFDLFAYDPDTNYNLGVHHSQDTKNFQQARYHYVLAQGLGDAEAGKKLAASALNAVDASPLFAQELLRANVNQRRWAIGGRLEHLVGGWYLDYPKEGFSFSLDADRNVLVLSGVANPEAGLSNAILMVFRLVYVDSTAFPEAVRERLRSELLRKRKLEFVQHGVRHQVSYTESKNLVWEVFF